MKRCLFALILGFSSLLFAGDPITCFPEGNYLGKGDFDTNYGLAGEYPSLANVSSDEIHFAHIVNGNSWSYHYYFSFGASEDGTFDITVTRHDDETSNEGKGYCKTHSCHFFVKIGEGFLEETFTFAPNGNFYKLGSLHLADENAEGGFKIITWEEALYPVGLDDINADNNPIPLPVVSPALPPSLPGLLGEEVAP